MYLKEFKVFLRKQFYMINISIWASGNGSNAENIIRFFKKNDKISINNIICNNKNAGVIKRAESLSTPCFIFNRKEIEEAKKLLKKIEELETNYIVLAGFLQKVPEKILTKYHGKILNIHPALLPDYGGKGMYGMHVHEAVINAKEKHSGISIHLVDKEYDTGKLIFQSICSISPNDNAESLAKKIHTLEQAHYPEVIKEYVLSFI